MISLNSKRDTISFEGVFVCEGHEVLFDYKNNTDVLVSETMNGRKMGGHNMSYNDAQQYAQKLISYGYVRF